MNSAKRGLDDARESGRLHKIAKIENYEQVVEALVVHLGDMLTTLITSHNWTLQLPQHAADQLEQIYSTLQNLINLAGNCPHNVTNKIWNICKQIWVWKSDIIKEGNQVKVDFSKVITSKVEDLYGVLCEEDDGVLDVVQDKCKFMYNMYKEGAGGWFLDRARLYASILETTKDLTQHADLVFDVYMDSIPIINQHAHHGIGGNLLNRCYKICCMSMKDEMVSRWISMQLDRIKENVLLKEQAIHVLEQCYATFTNKHYLNNKSLTPTVKKVCLYLCDLYLQNERVQMAMQCMEYVQSDAWNLVDDTEVLIMNLKMHAHAKNIPGIASCVNALKQVQETGIDVLLDAFSILINLHTKSGIQELDKLQMITTLIAAHTYLVQEGMIGKFMELVENEVEEDDKCEELVVSVVGLECVIVEATRPYNKQHCNTVFKQMWTKGTQCYQSASITSAIKYFHLALLYSHSMQSSKTARMLATCCMRQKELSQSLDYLDIADSKGSRSSITQIIRINVFMLQQNAQAALEQLQQLTAYTDFDISHLQIISARATSIKCFQIALEALKINLEIDMKCVDIITSMLLIIKQIFQGDERCELYVDQVEAGILQCCQIITKLTQQENEGDGIQECGILLLQICVALIKEQKLRRVSQTIIACTSGIFFKAGNEKLCKVCKILHCMLCLDVKHNSGVAVNSACQQAIEACSFGSTVLDTELLVQLYELCKRTERIDVVHVVLKKLLQFIQTTHSQHTSSIYKLFGIGELAYQVLHERQQSMTQTDVREDTSSYSVQMEQSLSLELKMSQHTDEHIKIQLQNNDTCNMDTQQQPICQNINSNQKVNMESKNISENLQQQQKLIQNKTLQKDSTQDMPVVIQEQQEFRLEFLNTSQDQNIQLGNVVAEHNNVNHSSSKTCKVNSQQNENYSSQINQKTVKCGGKILQVEMQCCSQNVRIHFIENKQQCKLECNYNNNNKYSDILTERQNQVEYKSDDIVGCLESPTFSTVSKDESNIPQHGFGSNNSNNNKNNNNKNNDNCLSKETNDCFGEEYLALKSSEKDIQQQQIASDQKVVASCASHNNTQIQESTSLQGSANVLCDDTEENCKPPSSLPNSTKNSQNEKTLVIEKAIFTNTRHHLEMKNKSDVGKRSGFLLRETEKKKNNVIQCIEVQRFAGISRSYTQGRQDCTSNDFPSESFLNVYQQQEQKEEVQSEYLIFGDEDGDSQTANKFLDNISQYLGRLSQSSQN